MWGKTTSDFVTPEMQFDSQTRKRKTTHTLTKDSCNEEEEDKLEWGSSKHSSFFTSTSASDMDLDHSPDKVYKDGINHSPGKIVLVDEGGLDYPPEVAKGGSDLLLPTNNDSVPYNYDFPPPMEPKVQDKTWIPEIASVIKLQAQIFRCETLEELKKCEDEMKANGQNTDPLDRRRSLLQYLECKTLWKYRMIKELFAFVPFIEGKTYSIDEVEALLDSVKNYCIEKELKSKYWFKNGRQPMWRIFDIVEECANILKDVEGVKFHPLIRKGYMNDLQKLSSLYERSERVRDLSRATLNACQFMSDCKERRVVERFFDEKIKADKKYLEAKQKVSLLHMFEAHIALLDFEKILEERNINLVKGDFDPEVEAEKLVKNGEVVPEKYKSLDEDLIKQPLEDILFFAKMIAQLASYGIFFCELMDEKDGKGSDETRIDSLIRSSEGVRFIECSKKYKEDSGLIPQSILDDKQIRDFIEAVGTVAFPDLPEQYVVRGILDYIDYLQEREKGDSFRKKYDEEFSSSMWRQFYCLEEHWGNTRCFDHVVIKDAKLTERIDFGEVEDIQKSLNDILGKMKLS